MNKKTKKISELLNAQLTNVKNKLSKKVENKLTEEQTTALAEFEGNLQSAIAELETLEADASNRQLLDVLNGVFSVFAQGLNLGKDELKEEFAENMAKLQKQIANRETKRKVVNMRFRKENAKKKEFVNYTDLILWTPEAETDYVASYRPVTGIANAFKFMTTEKTAVKVRKLTKEGDTVFLVVDPHTAKPKVEFTGSQNIVGLTKIAGIVQGISDEDIWSDGQITQEIENEAFAELSLAENTALKTLLATGEAFSTPYGSTTFVAPDDRQAILAAIVKLRQNIGNRASEIAVVMSSAQWALLDDLRSGTGVPISSDIINNQVIRVEDNTITDDTIYVVAKEFAVVKVFKAPFTKWHDDGVRYTTGTVKSGDATPVTKTFVSAVTTAWQVNEQDCLCEEGIIAYLRDTKCVIKGTISDIKTAISE